MSASLLALAFASTALASTALATSAYAQSPTQPDESHANHANWTLANRFSTATLRAATYTQAIQPHFLGQTDSLWYNWKDHNGSHFYLVVPTATGANKRSLFDAVKLAQALTTLHRKPYDQFNLPFQTVTFTKDHKVFRFNVDSSRYEWNLATESLKSIGKATRTPAADEERDLSGGGGRGGGGGGGGRGGGPGPDFRNFSPDSTAFAFARNHNLFVVEVGKGETTQVTTDGVEDYSFGARDTTENRRQLDALGVTGGQDSTQTEVTTQFNNPRDSRVRAAVTWAPDSKGFAIQRSDSRKVKELYLVNVLAEPRPVLLHYKYAMPGEENVPQQELWVYKRGDKSAKQLKLPRWKDQRLMDIHFPVTADKVRLLRRDRPQRTLDFIEVDVASGAIKTLLADSIENAALEPKPIQYLKKGGDFLWWSQKSGWGQFYVYGFDGGAEKYPLTVGAWNCDSVAKIDSLKGTVWVTGNGREAGEQVYQTHMYRVNGDGSGFAIVDPGDAHHTSYVSPTKRFVIDNYSRMDLAPRSVLRDQLTGKVVMPLDSMDLSKLKELGWKLAEPFSVKAADGVTDLYGNIWKPFDFDSTKKYPIIANVYPGPQTEAVTTGFTVGGVNMQMAQLGFIVIQIGHRGGTPQRSLAYHRFGYFNMRDYALADKKAGMEQLAARYKWIDLDRAGIYGHSGGGFLTAAAMLLPPYNEFFKVGWSESGNHDNNIYNQNWSEWNHGVKVIAKGDTAKKGNTRAVGTRGAGPNSQGDVATNAAVAADTSQDNIKFDIHVPTNEELAGNLKGNLALTTGDLDNNVHPGNTIRLANALIKANKRFDFFIYPGQPHGYRDTQPYNIRMMMEYFAEHLLGDYYHGNGEIK